MAGREAELAATKAVVDSVGQAERHHFMGWRLDIEAVYPALDVLLCPLEIEETFGRVVAQACGVPVIARDRGGLARGNGGWAHGRALAAAGGAWIACSRTAEVVETFVARLR